MTAAELDIHAATELDLYAENTAELHPQFMAIVRQMKRQIKRGTYSPELAPKAWRYWYDASARRYAQEFGTPDAPGGRWFDMFPPAVREHCAQERATYEHGRIVNGEYD